MIYDISSYHCILFYIIHHDEEYLPSHPPLAIGILLRRSMFYTSLWKKRPFIQTTKFRLTSKGPNYKKKDMNFLLCFGNFFRNSGRLGQNHGYLPSVRPINVWPRPQSPPRSSQTLWDDLLFLLALLPHWRIFIYCVVYVLCPIYIFSLEAYALSTFGLRPSLHLARPPPRRLLPVPYCAANALNQNLLLKKKMKVIF